MENEVVSDEKPKPGCLRCGENTECTGDENCWCQVTTPTEVTAKPCNFCSSCIRP